jgi:DNA invertase Pin-like site-specific DNA recombinase
MRKAYSYRRFSSAEQKKGRSKDRQWEECQAYCLAHNLELVTDEEYTFLDAGKSAYTGEHLHEDTGQLARFIKKVDDHSIPRGSYLIVESLDRLGRDRVPLALQRLMDLVRKGITVITLSDKRSYSENISEMDLMLSILIMSRAHEESSLKGDRVGDAFRKKQENARLNLIPMGNAVPLWLRMENGKYAPVPELAAVVVRIFQMSIDGYGKIAIARALNADHISTFKAVRGLAADGKPVRVVDSYGVESFHLPYESFRETTWGMSSVQKVLQNRAVIGEYQPYTKRAGAKRTPNGEPIKGYYPVIVSESMFYQAQDATDKRRTSRATKQSKNFNVYAGIGKCGLCRSAMHLVDKGALPKGRKYLRCSSSAKGVCKAKSVRLDHAEKVFREILVRLDSLALVQDNANRLASELSGASGRLAEKQLTRARLKALLRTNQSETIGELVQECEVEIKLLRQEEERLQKLLATERISNREDFLTKVDLDSYEGRSRANALVKRLDVLVYLGRGFYVTERGRWVFVLAYQNDEIGCIVVDEEMPFNCDGEVVAGQLLESMAGEYKFGTV